MALAFWTKHYFLDRADQIKLKNFFAVFPSGKYRAFVHERVQICAGEPWGTFCNQFQIDIFREWLLCSMYVKYLLSISTVRQVEHHFSIKSSRTNERRIQYVRSVRCCHDYNFIIWLKAIHFYEYLVECLLPFIVPTTKSSPAGATNRIYFIHEYYGWCCTFGHFEKVPHT